MTGRYEQAPGWTYLKGLKQDAGSYLALSACSRELNATLRVQTRARIAALFQQVARMEPKALDPLVFAHLCDLILGCNGLARFFPDLSVDDLQRLQERLFQRLNDDIIPD